MSELNKLSAEFKLWCSKHEIAPQSADELLYEFDSDCDEKEYLKSFITRWELCQLLDDHSASIEGTGGNCTTNNIQVGENYIWITDGNCEAITAAYDPKEDEICVAYYDGNTGDPIELDGLDFWCFDCADELRAFINKVKHTSA